MLRRDEATARVKTLDAELKSLGIDRETITFGPRTDGLPRTRVIVAIALTIISAVIAAFAVGLRHHPVEFLRVGGAALGAHAICAPGRGHHAELPASDDLLRLACIVGGLAHATTSRSLMRRGARRPD